MPLPFQPTVAKITEVFKAHLVARRAELARTPRCTDRFNSLEPHEDPHEQVAAEVACLETMTAMMERAQSDMNLISIYDYAKSLQSRVVEYPRTAGENAAGLYVFTRLRDLLDELGINPNPMTPSANPSTKRSAPPSS